MSKQNEPKLRNKSLLAMCSLLKLNRNSWGNPTASFLRMLAPIWPEGRQILFDLFSNTDIWIEANFSSAPIITNNNVSTLEIRLGLSMYSDKHDAYLRMIETWPKGNPSDVPSSSSLGHHRSDSYKSFCTGKNEIDYVRKHLEILKATMLWYPSK